MCAGKKIHNIKVHNKEKVNQHEQAVLKAPTAEVPHEIEGGDSSTHGTATAPGNPKNQKKRHDYKTYGEQNRQAQHHTVSR